MIATDIDERPGTSERSRIVEQVRLILTSVSMFPPVRSLPPGIKGLTGLIADNAPRAISHLEIKVNRA